MLLAHGLDPNFQMADGSRGLHIAASERNVELTEAILRKGALLRCSPCFTPVFITMKCYEPLRSLLSVHSILDLPVLMCSLSRLCMSAFCVSDNDHILDHLIPKLPVLVHTLVPQQSIPDFLYYFSSLWSTSRLCLLVRFCACLSESVPVDQVLIQIPSIPSVGLL